MSQLPLFGWKEDRPRLPLKAIVPRELVEQGKKLLDAGRINDAAAKMRDIRYKLEDYCKRIDV